MKRIRFLRDDIVKKYEYDTLSVINIDKEKKIAKTKMAMDEVEFNTLVFINNGKVFFKCHECGKLYRYYDLMKMFDIQDEELSSFIIENRTSTTLSNTILCKNCVDRFKNKFLIQKMFRSQINKFP